MRLSKNLTTLDATRIGAIERWGVANHRDGDAHIGVKVDAVSGTAIVSVTNTANVRAARITAVWDQQLQPAGWGSVVVDIWGNADPTTVARLNRVLGGETGFPKVETYHRTKSIVVRMPGKPRTVPARIARSTRGARWNHIPGLGPDQSADTAHGARPDGTPVLPAPVVPAPTPTSPTVTPAAPQPAAATWGSPEPTPEPTPAPEPSYEPIKVAPVERHATRPTCKCKGTCLFVYPPASEAGRIIVTPLNDAAIRAAVADHRDLRNRQPATVMLVGPKGTGKTELVTDYAARYGVGVFEMDGAAATSFADWVGSTGLSDNAAQTAAVTAFRYTALLDAIRLDGPHGDEERWVNVDELNRAETGGALNALISILSAGKVHIPETGETVRVSRNVMFFFTMNRGSNYAATVTLDAALADRAQTWLRTDHLDEAVEARLVADRTGLDYERSLALTKAAAQLRAVYDRGEISDTLSTRRLIVAASRVTKGLTLQQACETSWANYYSDEGGDQSERHLVNTAVNSALPTEE